MAGTGTVNEAGSKPVVGTAVAWVADGQAYGGRVVRVDCLLAIVANEETDRFYGLDFINNSWTLLSA